MVIQHEGEVFILIQNLHIKILIKYLVDRNYQIITDYPMSLRNYRLTVGLEY